MRFQRGLGAAGWMVLFQLRHGDATVAQLSQALGFSDQTVRRALNKMARVGLAERSGRGSAREPYVWSLVEHPDCTRAAELLGVAGRHDALLEQVKSERTVNREKYAKDAAKKWEASMQGPALRDVQFVIDDDGDEIVVPA